MLLNAWQLVEKSVKLYKENFRLFLNYVLLLYLPLLVIGILAEIILGFVKKGGLSSYSQFVMIGIGLAALIFVGSLVMIWFISAFIRVVATRYNKKPAGKMRQEIKEARKYTWTALGASVLSSLAIVGGLVLVVVPGIILAIWFTFVIYAVVLENKSSVAAMNSSRKLVAGRWWGVFGRLALPAIIVVVTSMAFDFIVRASASVLPDNPVGLVGVVVLVILSIVLEILLIPFMISAQTILYQELKNTPVKNNLKTN